MLALVQWKSVSSRPTVASASMTTSAVAGVPGKTASGGTKQPDLIRHALPIAAENGTRGRVSFTSGGRLSGPAGGELRDGQQEELGDLLLALPVGRAADGVRVDLQELYLGRAQRVGHLIGQAPHEVVLPVREGPTE